MPMLRDLALVRDLLRVDGIAGTARIVLARRATEAVFVWHALDLRRLDRPHPDLDEGLVLRRGTVHDAPLLERLPVDLAVTRLTRRVLEDRLAQGATLWLVQAGEHLAFHCWTFQTRFPLRGIQGGALALPADVVIVEDVVASPAFRGRGVAGAALTAVGDACRDGGARWMCMKVDGDDPVSQRLIAKIGYAEVARMHVVRRNWISRLRVSAVDDPAHRWLLQINRG